MQLGRKLVHTIVHHIWSNNFETALITLDWTIFEMVHGFLICTVSCPACSEVVKVVFKRSPF